MYGYNSPMTLLQRWERSGIIAVIISLLLLNLQGTTTASGGSDDFVTGQLVVKLNPLSGATIEQINATHGTTTIRPLVSIENIYLLQAPTGTDVKALVETMAADTRLLYAQLNRFSQVIEGEGRTRWARADSDPAVVTAQYAVNLLDLPAAHAISTGAETIVAVLDTGFQLDHPQLAASFTAERYDFLDNDADPTEEFANLDPDGDGYVNELAGHGTHVAGIVHLVAPDAKIMPLRVMDNNGVGNEFAAVEAIRYAVTHGAVVINLSLGTLDKSDLLLDVIGETFNNDRVVIVAAAGNDNTDQKLWPAVDSNVVAVTSVGSAKQKSDFANFGSWVDIAAPGEDITSAFPNNRFVSWSGTSFATPFIAGQFALMRSVNPTLDNNKLRQVLRDTAEPLPGEIGGFPNLVASLQSAQNGGESTPTATATLTATTTPTATVTPLPTAATSTPLPTPSATITIAATSPIPTAIVTPMAGTPTPPDGSGNLGRRFHLYLGVIQR